MLKLLEPKLDRPSIARKHLHLKFVPSVLPSATLSMATSQTEAQ